MALAVFEFLFFSSRRRHTRFDCDWSSDVCSSDLPVSHYYASADYYRYGPAPQFPTLKRAVPGEGLKSSGIYRPFSAGVYYGNVRPGPLFERTVLQMKDGRRCGGHHPDCVHERNYTRLHEFREYQAKRSLKSDKTGGTGPLILFPVRCVVGGNHIYHALLERPY